MQIGSRPFAVQASTSGLRLRRLEVTFSKAKSPEDLASIVHAQTQLFGLAAWRPFGFKSIHRRALFLNRFPGNRQLNNKEDGQTKNSNNKT
jgi:hypothetical protein